MTCDRRWAIVVATFCLTAAFDAAQELQEFEFVSVRRSLKPPAREAGAPPPRGEFLVLANGRLEVRGETLANLAAMAFGFDAEVKRGVVQATADWMLQDRFDITASASQPWTTTTTVPAELRTMLRALLEDRFSIETRVATKKVTAIALRVSDTKQLGPYLRRSSGECREPVVDSSPDETARTRRCPVTITHTEIEAQAVTMAEVAHIIPQHWLFADRLYVDQTGLSGLYDLSFSINRRRATTFEGMVEEQLGLKLQRTTVPLPSLIIERAKKPQQD